MLVQGLYYAFTGFWPVVEPVSFQAVTGPKTDVWLVQIFGATLGVIGCALLWAFKRQRMSGDLIGVAIGCGAVLVAGDIVFVAVGRIAPIYLADAAVHMALFVLWAVALRVTNRRQTRSDD